MRYKIYVILGLILAVTTAAWCASAKETIDLTIFCGAGLSGAFNEIGQLYQNDSGIGVEFNFDGVPALRAQIEQGAYADLLACADLKHINALKAEGYVNNSSLKIFAENKMAVVVPDDNPANISSLADLARPGIIILMGTKELPAGYYARQVLDKLANDSQYGPDYRYKVMANIVSEETTVNRIVSKVALGEADAGFAFVSDVSPVMVGKVAKISIPDRYNVIVDFPIGVLKHSRHPREAQDFIHLVMSPVGQAVLKKYEFGPAAMN
jgi:molybdate transport system substrate-binding protein